MTQSSSIKIPRLLLSGRPFLGQAAVPREKNLEALARFNKPQAIQEYLSEESKTGYGGILTLGSANIVAALRGLITSGNHASKPNQLAVLPIIPNVPDYVREATEFGMAGAGLRRLGRVGILGFLRASIVGASHPFKVLRKDFATLMSILFELEMAEFSRFFPSRGIFTPDDDRPCPKLRK